MSASLLARASLAACLVASLAAPSAGRPADSAAVEFSARLSRLAAEAGDGGEAAEALARSRGAVEGYLAVEVAGELFALPGVEPRTLTAAERRLLAACAGRIETQAVETHLRACLRAAEPGPDWRAAALELMHDHAHADSVELLEQLVPESSVGVRLRPYLALYRGALGAALGRDPRALQALDQHVFGRSDVSEEAVRAVASLGGPEAVAWITRRLDRDGLTDVALQELARLGPSLPFALARDAAEAVRPLVGGAEGARRTQVLRALAALRDEEAVPAMIEALESSEGVERQRVLAALRELSGLRLPDVAGAWRDWYDRERAWWRDAGPAALADLRSDDDADVVAAASALSARSLRRSFAALRLVDVLAEHPSSGVRAYVCAGLARLDAPGALPALVAALEDPDAEVRASAHGALRTLTGRDLPAEREAWERELAHE